jgi:hypothetical protein
MQGFLRNIRNSAILIKSDNYLLEGFCMKQRFFITLFLAIVLNITQNCYAVVSAAVAMGVIGGLGAAGAAIAALALGGKVKESNDKDIQALLKSEPR